MMESPSFTMLLSVSIMLLMVKYSLADYASNMNSGGWPQLQDLGIFGSHGGGGWNGHISIGSDHGWKQQHNEHHIHAIPIAEHIEVSKPIAVPVIKHIGIPLAQPIGIPVTHVTAVGVLQPFPVHVPVAHPVPIPVIKTIATIVEKKVPFPIEKIIPVPIEKHIPIPIEKKIPVPVEKPYPVHVPIYKHVFHRHKNHGWLD